MRPDKRKFSTITLAVIGALLYALCTFIIPAVLHPEKYNQLEEEAALLTKQEAARAALSFAEGRLQISDDYDAETPRVQSHTVLSGYLQKEKLDEKYEQQFEGLHPLDFYEVEIQDLGKQKVHYINIHPNKGSVLGWSTYESIAAKSESVYQPELQAEEIAANVIKEMGYELEQYKLVSAGMSGSLIYEHKEHAIGQAKLQLQLVISPSDGAVQSFHSSFALPGSHVAWQEEQNNFAALMTLVSLGISIVMAVISLVIMIRNHRLISFRRGLVLSLVVLVVSMITNVNMAPAFRTQHGAESSDLLMLFYVIFNGAIMLMFAVSSYFALSAGRHMWVKLGEPKVTWPVWRDASFGTHIKQAMLRGYLICIFIMGVQQLLFLIAEEGFDVWSISDPSSSVHNMIIPALFPLMAWVAAISEEAIYRLFGVALFMKLVRNRFLAVLIPSIIWAAMHTGYPIYPVYTRLVEVAILGLVFGWAFLRYGFMTAVFAHAAMDSILMGLSIMPLGGAVNISFGALYILFPALIGWLLAWLHSRRKPRGNEKSSEFEGELPVDLMMHHAHAGADGISKTAAPYPANPVKNRSGMAVASFILGIVTFILFIGGFIASSISGDSAASLFFIGTILTGMAGIIFGAVSLRTPRGKWAAWTGMLSSIIPIVLFALLLVIGFLIS